jgi:hypothetical protein
LGYDRNDRSTWNSKHLPEINNKGMCLDYAVTHEDFVWEIRSEPGVLDVFEKVLNTQDLIVSFDAVNFGLAGRTDLPANKPWPHQDQDPTKNGFRCLQGLVNLLPNGPDDGGLIVCSGAHLLSERFHKEMAWYVHHRSYKVLRRCTDEGNVGRRNRARTSPHGTPNGMASPTRV